MFLVTSAHPAIQGNCGERRAWLSLLRINRYTPAPETDTAVPATYRCNNRQSEYAKPRCRKYTKEDAIRQEIVGRCSEWCTTGDSERIQWSGHVRNTP